MGQKTKMQQTTDCGSDWWNDSNDHAELQHAFDEGAVGATSNPVITYQSVKNHPDVWIPEIDDMILKNQQASEDDILWLLCDKVGQKAAKILRPVYEMTNKQKGKLSLQVNPKYYRNADAMFKQGKYLASLAPNIAIKCPALPAGIKAMEMLTAVGITVNATVSFTVPQAVKVAEAIERGLEKAEKNGIDTTNVTPYVTIMVGRIDDHLKRIRESKGVNVDPEIIDWASIAIFKNAYRIFKEKNYKSKLLAAAFRCDLHWKEIVGGDIIISMPYEWWNKFNASDVDVKHRIDEPVDEKTVSLLKDNFEDFNKAYDESGMTESEFESFGASVHTMQTFLEGYDEFVALIRSRMIIGN
ncbi:MAG: transaldolase family protein [Candidatus Neomarinimicrobiota bacterium]|nr:transaldolase family protein [Candidatus Neomarinimicrobiota bacterium]MED5248700.1 transaldolase family protein [Candidatus Neomarinimicrobiota bacterium]